MNDHPNGQKDSGIPPRDGASPKPLSEEIWDALRTCYDPEISVNIVELGLIYQCEISDLPDHTQKVMIKMTFTSPGCAMGEVIRDEVQRKIQSLPGVKEVQIEIVFDPPWDSSRLSEAAKLKLGLM